MHSAKYKYNYQRSGRSIFVYWLTRVAPGLAKVVFWGFFKVFPALCVAPVEQILGHGLRPQNAGLRLDTYSLGNTFAVETSLMFL